METKKTTKLYLLELHDRTVRMVREHEAEHGSQWAAIRSTAEKVGCNAETLRLWVRRSERDRGARPGLTPGERDRLKALERENRELRQANEIAWRDNVFVERLWRTVNYEEIYLRAYTGVAEARASIGLYLGFYNARGHIAWRENARPSLHQLGDANPGGSLKLAADPLRTPASV